MNNILITSAGQRVSLLRAFKNELGEIFPTASVYAVDMNPCLSPACNIADKYFKICRVTDDDYIKQLMDLCITKEVKLVVPTIDTELLILARNKKYFKERGIEIVISSESFVSICRDKRKTSNFFKKHKIDVPQIFEKSNLTFPLFIKPFDGSLSVDTYLIENRDQLTDYHLSNERLLFMEYIDKKEYDEYTVDMFFGKDYEVKSIVPRKRLWVRAGEVNKALTCNNIIVNFLKERIGKIEGAIGCLTVQVFLNEKTNRIVGIEINPRFGGGYPLSYLAGANFPKWLINEYLLNETVNYTEDWEDNLLMLRYDDEVLVHGYKA